MFSPRQLARWVLAAAGGRIVVRVRRGFATGARWTAFPWSAYWRGTHEPEIQQVLLELGHGAIAGWSCWDLGSHYGIYSIGLARRVGPGGEVAAFEPNPLSFKRLHTHRRLNGLANLKLFQAAVSDVAGSSELFTYGELESTFTHLRYDGESGVGGQPIKVATVRLDDLVRAGALRAPDFIKIDVEGHGHRACAGARETIARKRPVVLAAFHCPEEEQGILAVLEPLGYERKQISTDDFLFTPAPR